MRQARGRRPADDILASVEIDAIERVQRGFVTAAAIALATIAGACQRPESTRAPTPPSAVLRVGIGQVATTSPTSGLRQLTQNLSVEGLARLAEDGRVEPWLAEKWTLAEDGRTLNITLKSGVTFHDGTPLDPATVAAILPDALRTALGPVFDDFESVTPAENGSIDLVFRRPSPFLLESLEVQVRKPGPRIVSTGAFMAAPDSDTNLQANRSYYRGRPPLNEIHVETYPTIRTAWANLLRGELDMLYEVGPDALDSLESSRNVSVFKFTRRYQYIVALNDQAPTLRSRDVRRALNMAIDRVQLVKDALNGHGVPSAGPIWPRYWAAGADLPTFGFDPKRAAELLDVMHPRAGTRTPTVQFTCLVPPDPNAERIALELKRQFAALGVDMGLRAASQDEILESERRRQYEAVLIDGVSGPTLLRPYQLWHSRSAANPGGGVGNRRVDEAFDRVRYAETEAAHRDAVAQLQAAFMDDPPAIFLAWTERARAVSRRFEVPSVESGGDVLRNLRLWKPVTDERRASRH